MIIISAIAKYLPEGGRNNLDKIDEFGFDRAFLEQKIGVLWTPRKADDEETSDMCVSAFRALQEKTGLDVDGVDSLFVCTQNPDGNGMPQSSAMVHSKLEVPTSCASFDISLACSGYVYSLSVAKSFMEANGLKKGLLFTCDPYSKVLDPKDRNTAVLFGDAATVTLLAEPEGGGGWNPVGFQFSTYSEYADDVHNRDGTFHMNGPGVVAFAMRELPGEVERLLRKTGRTVDDIDLFLFHQGSKFIVDNLIKRMSLPPHKAPIDIVKTGNTVSSSIPLLLERYLDDPDISRIVLSGFGVGISVGTGLIERIET